MFATGDVMREVTTHAAAAIQADEADEPEKAVENYKRAAERLILMHKWETTEASKTSYKKRADEYIARAAALLEIVKTRRERAVEVATKAAQPAARRATKDNGGDDGPTADNDRLRASLLATLTSTRMNEVRWDDVVGLKQAKLVLKETVIIPRDYPHFFTKERRPWTGILLYGPPGTGKSFLAKAVATEARSCFFGVSSADLVSKWQGDSERLVRELFALARERAPTILFIDEVDSVASTRGQGEGDGITRMKAELLVQMEGVKKSDDARVLVLGATNAPWALDTAVRRRFEKRIYIPLPDADARRDMFRANLGVSTPHTLVDADFVALAGRTENYSGADVSVVTRTALMIPVQRMSETETFRATADGKFVPSSEAEFAATCPHRVYAHLRIGPNGESTEETMTLTECSFCGFVRMRLTDVDNAAIACPPVTLADFEAALASTPSSVSPAELERFEEWTKQFGMEG